MWFCTKFGLKIDLGSVSASILPSGGCFWELLGDLGRPLGLPWGLQEMSLGPLGASLGLPGESLGNLWGPSWAPLVIQGSIWEWFDLQNHHFLLIFHRFLVSKSVSKRVRRKVSRRLFFDGVFEDGFVIFSRFSVEFAFSLTSRKAWFYRGETMIFATSLG